MTEDGQYITAFKDDNKRFGASLIALSKTRVSIISTNELTGSWAVIIAIRYSAVRKQFGPPNNEEIPILEYQTQVSLLYMIELTEYTKILQQYRLLPHLAAVYVLKVFSAKLDKVFQEYMENLESQDNLDMLGAELHAITSAAKPVSGWLMRDAIQSCREACGGHGYLKGK